MTPEESLGIIGILEVNYPSIYGKREEIKSALQAQTWFMAFEDYDFGLVHKALTAAMLKKPDFPPGLHEVMDEIRKITKPETNLSGAETAWVRIVDIAGRYPVSRPWGQWDDETKDRFDAERLNDRILSTPHAKRALTAIGGWDAVGAAEYDRASILQTQFIKIYNELARNDKEAAMLPPTLSSEIKSITALYGTDTGDNPVVVLIEDKVRQPFRQDNSRAGIETGLAHIGGILERLGVRA